MLVMVNINMTFVFRHPKFYRIPRDKSDQVISNAEATAASERAPDQGHKHRASGSKQQASSAKLVKHQAASIKPQA